jgi:hypothetical protein
MGNAMKPVRARKYPNVRKYPDTTLDWYTAIAIVGGSEPLVLDYR